MFFKKKRAISDETNVEKIEHKSKKNMALGAIFGYGAILVGLIYSVFLTPEIINFVGDKQYGLYGLATSILAIFLTDFGLGTTINTYLAKLRAKNDKEGVQRFLAALFKIYLTIDILFIVVIAGLYFSASYVFANTYGNPVTFEVTHDIQTLQYLFVIVGCYMCISTPSYCFTGVIQTYEKFSMIKIFDIVQKVLYLGLSVLAVELRWQIAGSGILVIVLINVSTMVFAIALRYLYMETYLNVHLDLRKGISKEEKKGVFSFSAWGFVLYLFSRLAFNITPFILGVVSNTDAVTLFTLITTIELYIFIVGDMTGSFFIAKLARTEADGTPEEKLKHLQSFSETVGKLQFVISAMIILGFASVGQEFILFWMRNNPDPHKFMALYWCIIGICGYEIVHIPEMVFQNAMFTHGHIKPIAISSIIKAFVNISLSFVLSYWFTKQFAHMWYGAGAIGASIAIAIARFVDLAINNYLYKKYLHINLKSFFSSIYLRGIITMIISLGVGIGLHYLPILNFSITLKLLVNGVLFVIVYLVCTAFITFNKKEREYYLGAVFELLHIKRKNKAQIEASVEVTEQAKIEENKSDE